MNHLVRNLLLVLFTATTANAFDIPTYKAFLEQTLNLTDAALLQQRKPASPYFSSIGSQNDNYLYLDSIKQKYKLTDGEMALLGKNNFVVSERMSFSTYASAFMDVFCKDMPVFLSTDAVLGTFHQSYDEVLIDVETTVLQPLVKEIVNDMRVAFPAIAVKYASLPENVTDVDLYLTIAAILSKNSNTAPATFADASRLKAVTDAITAEKFTTMPLFSDLPRDLDFSQFTVRGHYVKANLGDYFKTLMWLGRTEFEMVAAKDTIDAGTLKDLKRMSIDALILNEVLEQSGAKSKLAQMDALLAVLVGESDNLTPSELTSITAKSSITDVSKLLDDSTYERFAHILKTSPEAHQMILSQVMMEHQFNSNPDSIKYPVSFLLLGQRFLVDSYILGSVVYNKVQEKNYPYRWMPDPLDALYALGNNDALPLLKEELKVYNYGKYLENMRYLVDAYEPSFWRSSLYNTTLSALKTLNPQSYPSIDKQPLFMRSAAWHQQKLNTQLVAWSQLRHDNILYGKQAYTPGIECSYPHGFVEPYPELYKVLSTFASDAASRFGAIQNGSKYAKFYSGVASLMDTIGSLAVKELDGSMFTKGDSVFLSRMIALPSMMCGGPSIAGWYTRLLFSESVLDKGDFTVVDVHTQPYEGEVLVGKVLHTSVGRINLGVFLANSPSASNQPMAYIGPVSSYYQDTTLDFKRLTDEEWKDSVNAGKIPMRPDWTFSYLADKNGMEYSQGRMLDGIKFVPSSVKNRMIFTNKGLSVSSLVNGRGILLDLDKSDAVHVSVFDTRGRTVVSVQEKQLSAGSHSLLLPVASGVYTVRVKCGADVRSIPLTCIR